MLIFYVIESGKVTIQKKTGLLIFEPQALSQEGFEDINDAIKWIESRYGNPKRIGNQFIWQSQGTDNAYRIKFITVNQRGCYEGI